MIALHTRRALLGAGAAIIAAPSQALSRSAASISTVVGTGTAGMAGDGEPAATAGINNPYGVLIGPDGALYWADFGSDRVLRLDLQSRRVSVVAGNGTKGHSGDGGAAVRAQMSAPHEVRFDRAGNMYVAERDGQVVRHIDMRTGLISTIAGTGEPGFSGDGGPADKAQLKQPHSIALDRNDNLYICDILNNRVRRRDAATGIITTFAGTGEAADTADAAPLAGTPLRGARSIDFAPDGTMFLILREGNKIFAIDAAKQTLKHIGGTGQKGNTGDGGPAIAASLNGPKGISYSPDGSLYISDTENHTVRRLALAAGTITTVAGTGTRGDGPDGEPLACALARPHGVCVHGRDIYVGDAENHRIRVLRV